MKRSRVARLLPLVCLVTVDVSATTFTAKDDNAVVALDARTGGRLWHHFPKRLSQARCELHTDVLVVRGDVYVEPFAEFVSVLDPASGEPLDQPVPTTPPLASSSTFALPEVRLANGWRLDPGFSPGNDQSLDFVDGTGKVVWTIETGVYPDEVDAWQSSVFWSVSYLGTDGIVHAYEAGQNIPKWQFDPNLELSLPAPLTRPYLSVLGDDLFVGVHEHVFRLDPSSGKVLRKWNLSALTGVPFESNQNHALFSGGIDAGTFAADAATLVVGFETHLVALDRSSGDLLWHAAADAFPSDPFPLVKDGLLVVTANEGLAGPRQQTVTEAAESGCSLSTSTHGAWWSLLALAVAMGSFRRRAIRRERDQS